MHWGSHGETCGGRERRVEEERGVWMGIETYGWGERRMEEERGVWRGREAFGGLPAASESLMDT